MKEEMAALEARQAELRARLEDAPAKAPMALHPGLADVYRQKVAELSAALNDPAHRQEAAEVLRGLIEGITLVPVGGRLAIELVGALAGILALGKEERPRAGARGRQITVVAGIRNQRGLPAPNCRRTPVEFANRTRPIPSEDVGLEPD